MLGFGVGPARTNGSCRSTPPSALTHVRCRVAARPSGPARRAAGVGFAGRAVASLRLVGKPRPVSLLARTGVVTGAGKSCGARLQACAVVAFKGATHSCPSAVGARPVTGGRSSRAHSRPTSLGLRTSPSR